jgi:LuxR family transcriptional regulator, maltose regulon positive regulatory protein
MVDSLLSTKLRPSQSRPKLVARPRLTARFEWDAGRKLTLVSAPAGFGKSTLLAEWLGSAANRVRCVAWVSLDAGDNDPTRFLSYLVAALKTVEGGIGESVLALLRSPQPPDIEAMTGILVNDLAAIPGEITVILDDYHVIDSGPVHGMVSFLLDNLPPNAHLVISSRMDPPLPLPRLRARDQMVEIRAADLRFTPEEAGAFLREVMELDLTPEDVAALEARTEGWISGLQLAALSMRGREDVSSFVEAFAGSNRYVLDYLVEEVLARQPEAVTSFLLRTSILDRMSGELCDALTGGDSGQEMLEALERENLFVFALDEERRWYRYHHLFAEVLRHHLRRDRTYPVVELHSRASEWHADRGLADEAIGHAVAAGDPERAARLVERNAEAAVVRSEVATLARWLGTLPDDLVRSRPRLCVAKAVTLLVAGRPAEVESLLRDAERALGAGESSAVGEPAGDGPEGWLADVPAAIAVMRGTLARLRGDAPRAIELSRWTLARLPAESGFLRSVTAWDLGLAYTMVGDLPSAEETFARVVEDNLAAGGTYMALTALYALGRIRGIQGRLGEAERAHRRALDIAGGNNGSTLPAAAMGHVGLGDVLRERNDFEEAERHLTKGIELGKRGGLAVLIPDGYVSLSLVKLAKGDAEGALEAMSELRQPEQRTTATLGIAPAAAHRARLALAKGDVEATTRWADESGLGMDDQLAPEREVEHITFARVLLAWGKPGKALRLLERLEGAAEAGGRTGRVIEILILRALALRAADDTPQAVESLALALALAEPEGYVRLFADEGTPMAALLRQVLEARKKGRLAESPGISRDYVSGLLAAIETETSPPSEEGSLRTARVLVEPLSERELEVLRLIASGMPNRNIARNLFVAVSTVKTHVNNICRKLEARNRTQAVARARELDLL